MGYSRVKPEIETWWFVFFTWKCRMNSWPSLHLFDDVSMILTPLSFPIQFVHSLFVQQLHSTTMLLNPQQFYWKLEISSFALSLSNFYSLSWWHISRTFGLVLKVWDESISPRWKSRLISICQKVWNKQLRSFYSISILLILKVST